MKNLILKIAALGFVFLTTNAFALQSTNCSNADGSLKRVEIEIWGANIIQTIYRGQEIPAEQMFHRIHVLDEKVSQTEQGRTVTQTFASDLTITRTDGEPIEMVQPDLSRVLVPVFAKTEPVICVTVSSEALD